MIKIQAGHPIYLPFSVPTDKDWFLVKFYDYYEIGGKIYCRWETKRDVDGGRHILTDSEIGIFKTGQCFLIKLEYTGETLPNRAEIETYKIIGYHFIGVPK